MPKSRRHRVLVLLIGVISVVLLSPFLILIFLFNRVQPLLPVEDRVLQLAQEVLTSIKDVPPNGFIPTFRADCYAFLSENLERYGNQYTLNVTAALDPRYVPGGSWDATVVVHFPGEIDVELYFYAETWENCKIL